MDSKNNSIEYRDISSELWREYEYPDYTVRIEKPLQLHVKPCGTHYLVDVYGNSHILPSGWKHIAFRVKDGQPYFSF